MKHQDTIDQVFEVYKQHDFNGIKKVMDDNVTWIFLGRHPLAGIKKGINEVVAFFDKMGEIVMKSNPKIEKLITQENDDYAIKCIHFKRNSADGNNIDHHACVLWTLKMEKLLKADTSLQTRRP